MASPEQLVLFWLQSVIFLSAVTMSAAIVQGRWSSGTLASKFDRLWQAGELANSGSIPKLADLELCERVKALAADNSMPSIERLMKVRQLFESLIAVLSETVPARRVRMRQLPSTDARLTRFGFVDKLRKDVLGLQAVIVYGSSVSSECFADYDVVLVVENSHATLRSLENACLQWGGKELNLGVYTEQELWSMQLLSGDNLADYGLCLFGKVDLPEKSAELLLARNMSFGVVRQRQQLGMLCNASGDKPNPDDNLANLYHYFVKIPANIAKGTYGAAGKRRSKEEINSWLFGGCGFDTAREQVRALEGRAAAALANSAAATGNVLRRLNEEFQVVEPFNSQQVD